tara:strand:- start:14312 stop:14710 length:399 start_codon:yes stop_codon:yes gene_type:complete
VNPTFDLRTPEAASLLDGLVSVNLAQMDKTFQGEKGHYPVIKAIQSGALRYRRADPREHWKSWREVMQGVQDGFGADCEDLSSAVAAELLYNGIPARTYVYQSAPKLYHVVVATKKWGYLDPSRAAGMEGNG